MKRETAEAIVENVKNEIINLYESGFDCTDITEHQENRLVDSVLKIAKNGG